MANCTILVHKNIICMTYYTTTHNILYYKICFTKFNTMTYYISYTVYVIVLIFFYSNYIMESYLYSRLAEVIHHNQRFDVCSVHAVTVYLSVLCRLCPFKTEACWVAGSCALFRSRAVGTVLFTTHYILIQFS